MPLYGGAAPGGARRAALLREVYGKKGGVGR